MLYKANTLKNYTLHSLDGEIGKVKEFYFDDHHWTIRYLIVDTGNWLIGRQVLISPYALVNVNRDEQHISVSLTKKQIENSPSLDSDKPVSRQFEEAYYGYYKWPTYWDGAYMWGAYPIIMREQENATEDTKNKKVWDSHLRSSFDVSGYNIQATDGEIGRVDDYIIDDESWAIRYLVVDTQNWWSGKKVLISPQWIKSISWNDSKVFVNHLRENIKHSPEYTEASLLTRSYENRLHQYYNRNGYWINKQDAKGINAK